MPDHGCVAFICACRADLGEGNRRMDCQDKLWFPQTQRVSIQTTATVGLCAKSQVTTEHRTTAERDSENRDGAETMA